MALQIQKVSNPLTMIAVFASLAEIVATVVLPTLKDPVVQGTFVWFVMGFPVLLVLLFFMTLNFNNKVLYAPSDFSDEENFMRAYFGDTAAGATVADFGSEADAQAKLRQFWKPAGAIDQTNEAALQTWLTANGLTGISITEFMYGAKYKSARQQAVVALNL